MNLYYIDGKQFIDFDNSSFKEFNDNHPGIKISSNDLNSLHKKHLLLTDDNGDIKYRIPDDKVNEAYSKAVHHSYSFEHFSELLNKKGVSDIIKKASQTTKIEEKKSQGRGR